MQATFHINNEYIFKALSYPHISNNAINTCRRALETLNKRFNVRLKFEEADQGFFAKVPDVVEENFLEVKSQLKQTFATEIQTENFKLIAKLWVQKTQARIG